jgi:methionyl-tRNA synthetase
MKKKILITSALPYANGSLHFGHLAGAYLPADCYARFERMQGNDVLYICGSDEYGVAITLSAELAGRSPQEHVDHFHEINQKLFDKIGISFDHFSRTTTKEHAPVVEQFFLDLLAEGHIEERETEELYSESDNKFLADRYVVGTCPQCGYEQARGDECGKCGASYEAKDLKLPKSKLSGSPLTLRKTTHWFLLFDHFKEQLETFLKKKLWKPNVTNFAKRYVEEIKPRAITRDLNWGIPVPLPEAKGKVFYVWFDAPIGYISATKEWAVKKGKPDQWKDYWLDPKTKYVQFIGKDNIPFHAVFFPAMVMGQKTPYKLVDDLVANEFYNLEGKQFSKSEGWFIDTDDFFNRFGVDQLRYTLAANAPETADAEFTWNDFQTRCNAELVGKFGNLINRVLVFAQNNCSAQIPEAKELGETDLRFQNEMYRLTIDLHESYCDYRLRRVSTLLMELASAGNVYFDAKLPWKEAKTESGRASMETTIALCLECVKRLALSAYPLMPECAAKIWELLGFKTPINQETWKEGMERALVAKTALPKPYILFQKVEDEVIAMETAKLNELHVKIEDTPKLPLMPLKPSITIDDFAKLDLRVGLILKAEKVPKSKKLLQLEVDIGLEKRQILSGISLHFTPEQLMGKKVIVVANLQPAKLMGIESQGMILAGSIDAQLELAIIQDLPPGSEVR